MKLYLESIRNGHIQYTANSGMDEATVMALMTELGHTNITTITEEQYEAAIAALEI